MICQCRYVGEVSFSIKELFQICSFDDKTFFRNLFIENCVLSISTLGRCFDASFLQLAHYEPCELHVERHAIVLHTCSLHYGTDMIYISSPQPCGTSSFTPGNGDSLGHTFRVCGAMLSTL